MPPGGDGRKGKTGEEPARKAAIPAPALIGTEVTGGSLLKAPRARPVVGDGGACGRLGRDGPAIKGEPFNEGELPYSEGEPDDRAEDLKGCTREGRRMGTPPEGNSL